MNHRPAVRRYAFPNMTVYLDDANNLYMQLNNKRYALATPVVRIAPGMACHGEWRRCDEDVVMELNGHRYCMTPCDAFPFEPASFRDFDVHDGLEFHSSAVTFAHLKAFFRELQTDDRTQPRIFESALTDSMLTLVFGYCGDAGCAMEKIEVTPTLEHRTYATADDGVSWTLTTRGNVFTVSDALAVLRNLLAELPREWKSLPPERIVIPFEVSRASGKKNLLTPL